MILDERDGCILGDPKGDHIFIPGIPQLEVTARENISSNAQKLALSLLSLFFNKDKLSRGVCSPQGEGSQYELLDQRILNGIRCKWLN